MPLFVTASNSVHVWDETKNAPITNLTFGECLVALRFSWIFDTDCESCTTVGSSETVDVVRFNMAEASVLASIGSDRTMCLYDIRTGKAERRVMMQVKYRSTRHYSFACQRSSDFPCRCVPMPSPGRPLNQA